MEHFFRLQDSRCRISGSTEGPKLTQDPERELPLIEMTTQQILEEEEVFHDEMMYKRDIWEEPRKRDPRAEWECQQAEERNQLRERFASKTKANT